MKILRVLTGCGFSGSQGAQMNDYSRPPANHKVLYKVTQEMCSLGGEFRFQEKLLGPISMGSPTRGAAPLNPSDNPQA